MSRRQMNRTIKRIMFLADMHCGHRVGLTPPRHQPQVNDDAPHERKKWAEQRRIMWEWFEYRVKALRPINKLVVNGDAIEGDNKRNGGTELLVVERDEQVQIAADCINFVEAAEVVATFGTPYHCGQAEDWEKVLYQNVNNFLKLEAEGHYDVNGLQVAARHFIGNTNSSASRGTALSQSQVKNMLWAVRGQQPLANLIVRSHVHRCFGIDDPGSNFKAYTTPAMMGLGSKYGTRQCDGLPVDVGFMILDVVSADEWDMHAELLPLELGSASEVIKL